MEPNQGGWIKNYPALVKLINDDPLVFVVPQTYDFNMNPYGTADGIRVNLWDAGIKRDKVELYYGFKDRPSQYRWSGVIYDWNNFVSGLTLRGRVMQLLSPPQHHKKALLARAA
jgi:hypothetical protein